jgi:hypothetical protein
VKDAAQIADVDTPVAHGRRRLADALLDGILPELLPISEADGEQVTRCDADEHTTVGNRSR